MYPVIEPVCSSWKQGRQPENLVIYGQSLICVKSWSDQQLSSRDSSQMVTRTILALFPLLLGSDVLLCSLKTTGMNIKSYYFHNLFSLMNYRVPGSWQGERNLFLA